VGCTEIVGVAETADPRGHVMSSVWYRKRLLGRLRTITFPQEQVDLVKPQFADIVEYHIGLFNAWRPMDEQMRALALDCYLQGAIDGAQIPRALLKGIHA
jgi:hypothetical protein